MTDIYRKLYYILDTRERLQALLVFFFLVVVALAEVAGVVSILPFIAVLSNPEFIETNSILNGLYTSLGFEEIEPFLVFLGVVVFVMLIGSLVMKAAGFWLQVRFSDHRTHSIGYRLMRGYLHQPYEWFLNHHTSGMATTVLGETNQVVNGALFPALQVVAHGLVVLALVALLFVVDPWLALVSVTVLGVAYGFAYFLIRKYLLVLGTRRREANRARFRIVHEALGGIKDVLIGNTELLSLERFRVQSRKLAKYQSSSKLAGELPSFVMQGLVYGGMMAIILYLMTSRGGLQEALPVLSLYAFAGYRLMPALQAFYKQLAQLRFSKTTLDGLYDELVAVESQMRVINSKSTGQLSPLAESLALSNVSFQYGRAAQPALRGVTLRLPAFTTSGIVGPTGSGKTTLVDLILGLLQPSGGELLVDGVAVTPENVRSWQQKVGYVPQQIFLTDDSLTANIAFGIPENMVDHAAVERAARVANLHDFIMSDLPEGYATHVGERGVRLSGGQRQRIGIARALYRDPEILILDEATSALDNLTEKAVMDAVNNLGGKKTIIMIAHRLTTVRHCDQIVLMEKGQVGAIGTYDELMADNPTFREMASVGQ